MAGTAKLKDSRSPQVIIEKLARKRISDEEAEKALEQKWGRAYETPPLLRLLRGVFGQRVARKRLSR